MLTQCPACDTTFRVTAEQIKAKGGRVRCGQCQHAFNALDTLIDALPDSTLAPATEKRPDHFALPQHLLDEAATDATNSYTEDNDGVTPTITSSEILEFPEDIPDFETNAEEPRENFSDHPAPLEMPLEVASLTSSLTDLPEDTEEEKSVEKSAVDALTHNPTEQTDILLDGSFADLPKSTATRRWPWIVGSVLLLVTLGGQAVLALRTPLAKSFPAAQPAIAALCRIAPCTTSLPAQANLLSIEGSDLHPDPTKPGRLVVSATLKNRAAFSQQFPHLELTLTDIADKAILRKVLPPTTYLPANTVTTNGMLPNADVAVNLVIDIDPLTASGYRLYLFYP
ncbi:MAG: DUF3426 domain-containing protein [Rugosibacter sp.]|jgi:predicted Zn finger-like uncharacterized protein|nr:DUF3426 domain-containing protein [Rugosibacter sp.]